MKWVAYKKNRKITSHSLEAGSPRSGIRVPAQAACRESPLRVADSRLLLVSSRGRGQREEASSCVTHKGMDPVHEGSTLITSSILTFQRLHFLMYHMGGGRVQRTNFRRIQTFPSIPFLLSVVAIFNPSPPMWGFEVLGKVWSFSTSPISDVFIKESLGVRIPMSQGMLFWVIFL